MHVRRIKIWILCSACAFTLAVGARAPAAAPLDESAAVELFTVGSAAGSAAEPNCANMIAQAGGAAVGLIAQTNQLTRVCNARGWTSTQCLAQGVVVAQSIGWFWWTASQVYCQCMDNPSQLYCQGIGALPPPPNPGGGGGAMPPPGPPPPPPAPAPKPLPVPPVPHSTHDTSAL